MAKQKELIADRQYVTKSVRWYRKIGANRYRFSRYTAADGGITIVAERALGWKKWEEVHHWYVSAYENGKKVRDDTVI